MAQDSTGRFSNSSKKDTPLSGCKHTTYQVAVYEAADLPMGQLAPVFCNKFK